MSSLLLGCLALAVIVTLQRSYTRLILIILCFAVVTQTANIPLAVLAIVSWILVDWRSDRTRLQVSLAMASVVLLVVCIAGHSLMSDSAQSVLAYLSVLSSLALAISLRRDFARTAMDTTTVDSNKSSSLSVST